VRECPVEDNVTAAFAPVNTERGEVQEGSDSDDPDVRNAMKSLISVSKVHMQVIPIRKEVQSTEMKGQKMRIEYDIAYSPAYQVPALYLTVYALDPTTNGQSPVLELENIYASIVPAGQVPLLKDHDVLGAISSTV
jgi:hypothetical protein